MADFSALKTAIQANIRTNGNEEITGAILQEILLSMVTTMGDGAINGLVTALQEEVVARQNAVGGEATARQDADSALSGRINGEATARGEADTLLQNAINGITTRLNEGYVYAGIATPSTNPGTPAGKVFYIALQAGTYTNFSSLAVTQGITILKYNGTAWSQEQLIAIDDEPTAGSNNLVKSGGVYRGILFSEIKEAQSTIVDAGILKDNGTIQNDGWTSGGSVASFALQADRIYKIILTTPLFSNNYSVAALYKNNVYVKSVELCDSVSELREFIIDTRFETFDELKIGYKKNTLYSVTVSNVIHHTDNYVKQLEIDKLSPDTIVSLTGSIQTLTRQSIVSSAGIQSDGTIEESSWVASGNVLSFAIESDRIIRLRHNIPAFHSGYLSAALYYQGNFVQSVAKCDGTNRDEYLIIDTTGLQVDELKICNYRYATTKTLVVMTCKKVGKPVPALSALSLIEVPPTSFGLTYNTGGINFLNRIYIEGLLKGLPDGITDNEKLNIKVNDAQNVFPFKGSVRTEGLAQKNVYVTADGYEKGQLSVSEMRTSPTRLQNVKPRIIQIGDSLTDNGFPALTEFLFKCYNADLGNISALMVGTKIDNINFKLGNYDFTCKGANEGQSGWSISDYLRHIVCVRRADNVTQRNFITGKAAWDSLGLGTMTRNGTPSRAYVDFNDSQAQGELIRTTCHGYYDADPSQELWTWLTQTQGMTTFTYNGVVYTFSGSYTSADDATQIAAIKYLCEHPVNVFYDKDTVESSNGSYAFSFSKYLAKYKTLANDGSTRLVVGSTAGTEITNDNINVYDVCEPTHAVIVMNENEVNNVNDGEVVAVDLILMANLIKSYSGSIKIAIGTTRGYGVLNQDAYGLVGYMNSFTFVKRRYDTYKKLMQLIADTTFTHIPIYAIQTPNGTAGGYAYDTLDYKEREMYAGDSLHAGDNLLYLDRAYQVISWIAYTLI